MAIQVINPINDLRWDNLTAEHPLSSVYHHSSWKLLKTLGDIVYNKYLL